MNLRSLVELLQVEVAQLENANLEREVKSRLAVRHHERAVLERRIGLLTAEVEALRTRPEPADLGAENLVFVLTCLISGGAFTLSMTPLGLSIVSLAIFVVPLSFGLWLGSKIRNQFGPAQLS